MTPIIKKWLWILIIGLLAIGVGILIFNAFDPIVANIDKTRAEVAGSNAFSSFLMIDTDFVAHPRDIYIVHYNYHIHVNSVSYKDAELIKLTSPANTVHIGKELDEGTYESGSYVREISEKIFVYEELSPGDSLEGLRIANNFESIPGYSYYGTMENCDIYIRDY